MYNTFDATITVYNVKKTADATADVWIRTIFKPDDSNYSGVSWYSKTKVQIGEAGLIGADEYKIRIREDIMANYIAPEEWNAAETAADLKGKWTMQNGDFIRKGETTEEDPTTFNIDIAEVIAVHDNRRGIPTMRHLMIEGK